jgi:hypothetical protein
MLWNVLIALTQLLNALIGGFCDETTSSRAHRQQHKRRWRLARRAINAVFFWQDDHCRIAWQSEKERRHLPPELR